MNRIEHSRSERGSGGYNEAAQYSLNVGKQLRPIYRMGPEFYLGEFDGRAPGGVVSICLDRLALRLLRGGVFD